MYTHVDLRSAVISENIAKLTEIAEDQPELLAEIVDERTGRTALHEAVYFHKDRVIEFLLDHQVDVHRVDANNLRADQIENCSWRGHGRNYLGVKLEKIIDLIRKGNLPKLISLVDKQPSLFTLPLNFNESTAMHIAAAAGKSRILQYILEKLSMFLNKTPREILNAYKDRNRRTALYDAVINCQLTVVANLLTYQVNPNIIDNITGDSLLHFNIPKRDEVGYAEIADLLIQAGANLFHKNHQGLRPDMVFPGYYRAKLRQLNQAIHKHHVETVVSFALHNKQWLGLPLWGVSLLFNLTRPRQTHFLITVLKTLVQRSNKSIEVWIRDIRDDNGSTLLHYAMSTANSRLLTFLIQEGADVNAVNQLNRLPLDYARSQSMARQLVKHGTKLRYCPQVLDRLSLVKMRLTDVIKRNKLTEIKRFANENITWLSGPIYNNNWTALHVAVQLGKVKSLAFILKQIAYRTGRSERTILNEAGLEAGQTLVHTAIEYNQRHSLEYLLAKHVDVDVPYVHPFYEDPITPIQFAVIRNNLTYVKLLVKAHANLLSLVGWSCLNESLFSNELQRYFSQKKRTMFMAAMQGDEKMIREMARENIDWLSLPLNRHNQNALHLAAANGKQDLAILIQYLIVSNVRRPLLQENQKMDIHSRDAHRLTAMDYLAINALAQINKDTPVEIVPPAPVAVDEEEETELLIFPTDAKPETASVADEAIIESAVSTSVLTTEHVITNKLFPDDLIRETSQVLDEFKEKINTRLQQKIEKWQKKLIGVEDLENLERTWHAKEKAIETLVKLLIALPSSVNLLAKPEIRENIQHLSEVKQLVQCRPAALEYILADKRLLGWITARQSTIKEIGALVPGPLLEKYYALRQEEVTVQTVIQSKKISTSTGVLGLFSPSQMSAVAALDKLNAYYVTAHEYLEVHQKMKCIATLAKLDKLAEQYLKYHPKDEKIISLKQDAKRLQQLLGGKHDDVCALYEDAQKHMAALQTASTADAKQQTHKCQRVLTKLDSLCYRRLQRNPNDPVLLEIQNYSKMMRESIRSTITKRLSNR